MSHIQTENFPLKELRAACGLSVTDIHIISDVSRATLHKIESGKGVRFDTACRILQKMYASPKCEHASLLIADELRKIGAARVDLGVDKISADRIESAKEELEGLLYQGDRISSPRLLEAVRDLRDAAEELLKMSK